MMTTDQQALLKQIIEAGALGAKLYRLEDADPELEQTGRAFDAAMSQLPQHSAAVFMVSKLLARKPFSLTSDNPDTIALLTAVARELGATVEASDGGPWAEALPSSVRSIVVSPPPCAS
jgi:hypothetical protein